MAGLLQSYLKQNKVSQRALAQQVQCTPASINNLVKGRYTDIKISFLRELHTATGIPMSDLIQDLLSYKHGAERVGESCPGRLE